MVRPSVTGLLTPPRQGIPWARGDRYFRLVNPGELDQDQLVVAESLDELVAGGRVLLDPNPLSADGTVALNAVEVSPDGALVAVALAEAGLGLAHHPGLRRGHRQRPLPDVLTWTKWVPPTWLPDSSGFLYWRYPAPAGSEFTDAMGAGELVLHRLGTGQDHRPAGLGPAGRSRVDDVPGGVGRRSVADAAVRSPGTDSRATVEARRIGTDAAGLALTESDGIAVVGELTDAQSVVAGTRTTGCTCAPRPAPSAAGWWPSISPTPALPWIEIVAEHPTDVLADVAAGASGFVLTWSSDAAHRVEVVDRVGDLGRMSSCRTRRRWRRSRPHRSDEVFLGQHVVHPAAGGAPLRPGGGHPRTRPRSRRVRADPDGLHARAAARHRADGTAVPMTVLRRTDLPPGPRPTLLYGYGGFDIPVLPTFRRCSRRGCRPAGCWRWPTCAAAGSSVPPGTRPG